MEVIDWTHWSEGNPQFWTDTKNQKQKKKINTLKQEKGELFSTTECLLTNVVGIMEFEINILQFT